MFSVVSPQMKLIRPFSELNRPQDIVLGSELFRLEDALNRKQLTAAESIIRGIPRRVSAEHVEWLLACFLEFISIMIDQRDCEQTKRYVDVFSTTVMEYSISKEEKAAFYLNLANAFFAHSTPLSRYIGSEYAAHYIHTSFLYHPLDLNDPRARLLDIIEKSFFLNITEGKGQLVDDFEVKWRFFREELYRLRRTTRDRLSSVDERKPLEITSIRNEFNTDIRSLIAVIADEMLRRLISPAKPLPCDVTLLGVGSVALNYFTALSDFDIALLVSKEANRGSEFFQNFIHLLRFELICMGEEQSENLSHQKIAGTCIDPDNRSLLLAKDDEGYSSLIDTPEAMAKRWFFRRDAVGIISNEVNEMLRTVALYSSSKKVDLAERYQHFFHAQRDGFTQEDCLRALDKHMDISRNKLIKFCNEVSKKNEELISVAQIKFDFKEVLIRPLLLWISDVAFIFGNTTASLDNFFDTLSKVGFVDSVFIERLRFGLEYLWKLKFELEYDGKFVSTGKDFSIDYDELSEDKRQMISELIETLILPLTASAKNVIHHVLMYHTYTASSFAQRMAWYQTIKSDLIVPDESGAKEIILRTFDVNAPFIINPLVNNTIKINTYALSRAVADQLIVREADDLVRLSDQDILANRPDFLPLTTREGKIAYWLSCFPTPGYHGGLFDDFSNLYTQAIGNSQIVVLQLFDVGWPCLLIERRQNNHQPSAVSLSDEVWTSLLLRALLLDSEGRVRQAQCVYCLDQMIQPERLDPFVIKRFFYLEELVMTDWYAQLKVMNDAYTALGVPSELISIEQESFRELASKLNERYEILKRRISTRSPVTGLDLLASVDPVSVYYYHYSFNEFPVMNAQQRYSAVSRAIALVQKQYIRGRSRSSTRGVIETEGELRQRLIDVDDTIRHTARNELEELLDREKYEVMTGFFQENLLSTEPSKRRKQISYMAKSFAIIFPIVSEPLKNYMAPEEFTLFNRQVSEFRTRPISSQPIPTPIPPSRPEDRNMDREELSELNRLILAGAFISDENVYGQTVLHLAAKHGNAAMINDLLSKLSDAEKLDMAYQRNHAGWTFLHYIIEKGDASWNESTFHELFNYLSAGAVKIIATPNMHDSTPFHTMAYNNGGRWNDTDLALFLRYLGNEARGLLCMPGRRKFTPVHYLTRNKSKKWDMSALVNVFKYLDSSAKKMLIKMLDEDGWSPLHYLARGKYTQWTKEAISFLLDGVDAFAVQSAIMLPGSQDWTPFHLAIRYNTTGTVKMLFDFLGANAIAILTRNGEDCVSHIKLATGNTIDKDAMVALVVGWKIGLKIVLPDPEPTPTPRPGPLPIIEEPLHVTDEVLGKGKFATVLKGRYRNQDVAVKRYECDRLPERILDEARKELSVMEKLDQHPNIVGFFYLENSIPPLLVLEYCAGGSLYRFLNSDQHIDWGLRLRMSLDIANGLAYSHEKNVVHGDIKSHNVLLTKENVAKLSDFGLSRIRSHASSSSTRSGSVSGMGTSNWMAPELFGRNASKPQKTSDIWAFGMVLFEIANRVLPFADAPNIDEMRDWIKQGDGEKLPEEGYPEAPQFSDLMKRCWGIDINKRIKANEAVVVLTGGNVSLSLHVTDEVLGKGKFATVLKGRYRNQDVAVKRYECDRLPERILDEAQKELSVMEKLDQHPNIVGFFYLENSIPPLLVLEYCAGGSLYCFLNSDQQIDWGLRLRMSLDIANGLAYSHEKNVVHGDIKSSNVLLTKENVAKLSDFGLSRIRSHAGSSSTRSGSVEGAGVGTINWMAPELFGRNASKPQETSDIWAFGMVLFEIANRVLPFADAPNTDEMRDWIKEGDGERLPEEGYPEAPQFSDLMKRCWGKDVTKRITANEAIVVLKGSVPEVTCIMSSENPWDQFEVTEAVDNPWDQFEITEMDEKFNEKNGSQKNNSVRQNQLGNQNQGYIRHEVAGDGDCGYTAFGIIRKEAMQLLLKNIHHISDIIKIPVRHALLTQEFYEYLFCQNKIDVKREYLWKNEQLLKQYVNSLIIQEAYIQYDVENKSIDAGYSHPAILQALAHIQHIEIHIWRLGENDVLVPHDTLEGNYAVYNRSGSAPRDRVDLLFIHGNHFERLEILGYGDDIPNRGIYPLDSLWNQHDDVHAEEKKQSNQEMIAKAKPVENSMVTGFNNLLIDKTKLKIFENNKLGEGTYGVVYKGTYGFQLVAVKRYLGDGVLEKDIKKVQHELQVMHALRHECLVRLLGFVYEENGPGMIVMEYAANGSLYHYLQRSKDISWSVRLRIAEELARGLAYLHLENVIHRDIKSLNVVLDGGLHAKLCDFGLATLKIHSLNSFQESQRTSKKITLQPVGTDNWMAPEVLRDVLFSRASDIWALGMVYFELASRQVPYRGLNQAQIIYKISHNQSETIPEACRFEAPQFAALMERCWAARAEARPTAVQLVEELGPLVESSEPSLLSISSIHSLGYKSG